MIKDCPQPETPWKPIVVGAPFWSQKRQWNNPVQLELFERQFEMFRERKGVQGDYDVRR